MPQVSLPLTIPTRFSVIVNLNPASIALNTTASQTFNATTYPKLKGLKPNVPTFVQFRTTPEFSDVVIVSAACYTKDILTVTFNNVNAGARDLAAADFLVWQL